MKKTSKNIKLFQEIDTIKNTALYPWLLTNIKISYEGKQNKEELFSIGLNLVNGTMKTKMMEILQSLQLNITISDYCYPISPIIKLNSGFIRIETVINNYLENQSHEWATESLNTLKEEIQMVQHFFDNEDEEGNMEKEMNDLTKRYTPSISYQVVNGGIIYLAEDRI